jgi:hypothetical protein
MLASVLTSNKGEPNVFYAVNNNGYFASPDAGSTWIELPIHWTRMARANALVAVQN